MACVWCKDHECKGGNAFCKLCGKQINKEQIVLGNTVKPLFPNSTPRWCPKKGERK